MNGPEELEMRQELIRRDRERNEHAIREQKGILRYWFERIFTDRTFDSLPLHLGDLDEVAPYVTLEEMADLLGQQFKRQYRELPEGSYAFTGYSTNEEYAIETHTTEIISFPDW